MRLRRRHRLKKKEIAALSRELAEFLGVAVPLGDYVDVAELGMMRVILSENELIGLFVNDVPFLTVKGLLRYQPVRRFVDVDSGAIKPICEGADVMAPGIVDADRSIQKDDIVWVRDQAHKRPLAVGIALMNGLEMKASESGKAARIVHHIGDKLWG